MANGVSETSCGLQSFSEKEQKYGEYVSRNACHSLPLAWVTPTIPICPSDLAV